MTSVQFALPLMMDDKPTLSNFIGLDNAELLAQCQSICFNEFEHTALYIWGVSGSGKSHLLNALAFMPYARFLHTSDLDLEITLTNTVRVYVLEQVDVLTKLQQKNLFHLYNNIRAQHQTIVLSALCSPFQLPADFLPDLKTRLSWGLTYQLEPLTDEDKAQVIIEQAEQRGLTLGAGVVVYMLRHLSRDLSQLHRFLLHLDEYSLQKQRAVTLPLLKEWLNHDNAD